MRAAERRPLKRTILLRVVARVLERGACLRERHGHREDDSLLACDFIRNDPRIQEAPRMVKLMAPTDSTVRIQGESGTGKEIVVRSIHYRSHWRERQFVPVNCGAFTESLLESELLGHLRSALPAESDRALPPSLARPKR